MSTQGWIKVYTVLRTVLEKLKIMCEYEDLQWEKKSQWNTGVMEIQVPFLWDLFMQFTRCAYLDMLADCNLPFFIYLEYSMIPRYSQEPPSMWKCEALKFKLLTLHDKSTSDPWIVELSFK